MELPRLIILLSCATIGFAGHASHVIPVEGYETVLQNLGEHVEYPEPPVKVIKITKTIAVKVPVPYPVKVVEKVPYPVHVNKPYPVPVPQIIKVPVAQHPHGHEAFDVGHHNQFQDRQHTGDSYQVQEQPHEQESHDGSGNQAYDGGNQAYDGGNQAYDGGNQAFDGGNHGDSYSPSNGYSAEGSSGQYSQAPQHDQGAADDLDGHNSFESKSYDLAIQNYLNNLKQNGDHAGQGLYH